MERYGRTTTCKERAKKGTSLQAGRGFVFRLRVSQIIFSAIKKNSPPLVASRSKRKMRQVLFLSRQLKQMSVMSVTHSEYDAG
jgi:hypothetical protein